jgi:hypothetical protein
LPLGWAILGVALGLGLLQSLTRLGLNADAISLAAAVPLLLAAVVAVRRLGDGHSADGRRDRLTSTAVPGVRDRYPGLIRLAVIWTAASTAAVVVLWPHLAGAWHGETISGGPTTPVLLQAAAIGVAIVVCERSGKSRSYSGGGLGVACAAGGVGVAVAISAPALGYAVPAEAPASWLALLSACTVAGFSTGFALAYGHLAVLCRLGSQATGGAGLLSATLATWGAVVFCLLQRHGTDRGSYVLAAAVAVSLVALGGVTIIHEPTYSARTRRRRLGAVFLCVALMIGVLPVAGRRWLAHAAAGPPPDNHLAGPAPAVAQAPPISSVEAGAP